MSEADTKSNRPATVWVAILAIGAQSLFTVPEIVRGTVGCWLHGSRGGIGIHSGSFLPTVCITLVNFFVLPLCAMLLFGSGGSAAATRLHNALGAAALSMAVLMLVPEPIWNRATWLVAGPGPGGVYEMMDAANACEVGDFEVLKRMGVGTRGAEERKLLSSGSPLRRDTPLVLASAQGCMPIVEALLELGVSTEAIHEWGQETAIFAAARHGHLDVVRRLDRAGADVHGRNESGHDLMQVARSSRSEEVVAYLERRLAR